MWPQLPIVEMKRPDLCVCITKEVESEERETRTESKGLKPFPHTIVLFGYRH